MTIGFITRNYPPITEGGAEISLFYLANSLAKRGVNVRIFVPDDTTGKDLCYGKNPKIYRFKWPIKSPFSLESPWNSKRFVKKVLSANEKMDIIDGWNYITPLQSLAENLKIPYIISIRDATPLCDVRSCLFPKHYNFPFYIILRLKKFGIFPKEILNSLFGYYLTQKRLNIIKKANFLTYASQAIKNLFKKYNKNGEIIYSIAPSKKEIGNFPEIKGIDFSKYKVFLYAGRLSYGKGSKLLLEVAEKIAQNSTNIKFIFVGRGKYLNLITGTKYKSSIFALDRLTHKDVLALMSKSRSVIVPSIIFEAFSRTAIESISLGTPVIGMKSGGIPEAVGKAGIIVNSKEALEKAILEISGDNNLFNKLKKEAKHQSDKFSEDKIANKVLRIYERILK